MTDYSDGFDHDSPRVAAVNWWIRMRAGALSAAEKAEFDAWRAADPANAAAFDDMADMCGFVERLAPSRRPEPPRVAPRRRASLAGAATMAVALCLAMAVGFGDLATWLRSDLYAGVGDRKSVTLEDGSRVELDARSAIALHFEPGRRRLTLLEGEAWFQVAPDAARPFVVEAAGGSVTALGTAFDIALDKGEARVTVTEHSVAVASGGDSVVVGEGAQSAFSAERAARPEAVDVKRATAWRRGRLIFENKPLGEVLAALGRHRRGYVYCIGEASCERRVTGVFDAENPAQALREIEAFLGLRAIHVTDYLILLHG
ncbi:FecR family protein [Methylosinus sp. LW4]|uniref:FecR family protein n=1 Tax=Methylosinus sp. LW4 TaxID=136993 RepID=UPI00036D13F0|nr:FecR domain-containing protein [Methylosinus sp. LW4]